MRKTSNKGRKLGVKAAPGKNGGVRARYPKPSLPPRRFVSPRAEAARTKATITYIRVGSVERPSSRGYVWHDGYSENGNTYPWLTKREAQRDASSRGAKAVFIEYRGAREGHRVAATPPPPRRGQSALPPQFPSHWRHIPPGSENARGIGCREAKAMVWYFPYGETVYDVSGRSVATIDLCFDSLEEARRFYDTVVSSGDIEAAELRAADGKSPRGRLIDEFKDARGSVESPRGGHRVADFNSLDALLRHERDENGAKYTYRSPGSVRIYYPDGKGFKEGVAWQEQGYWHAQAPSERVSVTKPPKGSEAIVGKSLMEARRGAAPSPADRRTARGAEARGGKMREDPPPDAEAAGAQYAEDQINSDYFLDWVRDQLAEAADMDPSEVLPLETQADAMEIAKNMLQQLKWDTSRDLEPREIARLIGVDDTTREDVKEFFKGFRETLDTNRAWLAEELLRLKGEMK